MKLKSIKLILVSALISGVGVSCSDILDVAPDDRITMDDVFASETTTQYYLNGCYQGFPNFGLSYYFWTNIPITIGDDALEIAGGNTNMNIYQGSTTSVQGSNYLCWLPGASQMFGAGTGLNTWDHYYRNISRCNIFLNRIADAAVPSEAERSRWTAEAKVLRAFYYMMLQSYYGPVPIIKDELPVNYDYSKLVRNSSKEIADFIVESCDEAIACEDLPWRISLSNESGRMTRGIAAAIKSRAALFAASPLYCDGEDNWDFALEQTKQAYEELIANDYALYTAVTQPTIFASYDSSFSPNFEKYNDAASYKEFYTSLYAYSPDPVDKQTILASSNVQQGFNVLGLPMIMAAKVGFTPTQELVDAYPMADGSYVLDLAKPYNDEKHLDPNYNADSSYDQENPYDGRDPRFYANIHYNGSKSIDKWAKLVDIWTYNGAFITDSKGAKYPSGIQTTVMKQTLTGYYTAKYRHPQDRWVPNAKTITIRAMHMAEIYLNYAEAMLESTGDFAAALAILDPIRDRVNMPHMTATSIEDARFQIRNERRVELSLEENRYFDNRRWTEPGHDLDNIRFVTGMWIEKEADGSFSYRRAQFGDTYNKATDTWAGTGFERQNYTSKYLLHPLERSEANRMKELTGVEWQNPGW